MGACENRRQSLHVYVSKALLQPSFGTKNEKQRENFQFRLHRCTIFYVLSEGVLRRTGDFELQNQAMY